MRCSLKSEMLFLTGTDKGTCRLISHIVFSKPKAAVIACVAHSTCRQTLTLCCRLSRQLSALFSSCQLMCNKISYYQSESHGLNISSQLHEWVCFWFLPRSITTGPCACFHKCHQCLPWVSTIGTCWKYLLCWFNGAFPNLILSHIQLLLKDYERHRPQWITHTHNTTVNEKPFNQMSAAVVDLCADGM